MDVTERNSKNGSDRKSGGTASVWTGTLPESSRNHPIGFQLTENRTVDTCVIGGGIAGLTTAYLLTKEGRDVCILEDQEIGMGQTAQTTAHVSMVLDRRYFELEKTFGIRNVRLVAQSHRAGIDKIEAIAQSEDIKCDLERVNGYLFAAPDASIDELTKEMQALHRMGYDQVHSLPRAPLEGFATGTCLSFPNQIQLHALKYIRGLAQSIVRAGTPIFTNTHVVSIEGGSTPSVRTREGYIVRAKNIVVATNTPINNIVTIHTKQSAYRTYAIAVPVPKGSVVHSLFWDTEGPYHYIRVQPGETDSDLLIVGGEDHKTGQNDDPQDCFARLLEWTRDRFPMCESPVFQWSGQVMEPFDGLAFIGANPGEKNVYIITGQSGNGFTYSTMGAMLISDIINGAENEWASIYDPARVATHSLGTYLKENINVARQYTDWLNFESSDSLALLDCNEGTVINKGMKKVAVYKNGEGRLEYLSAACPHLGAVVHWNAVEKSWDCPCHGSRFDCHGKVIEGPAVDNLAQLKKPREFQDLPKFGEEIFPANGPNVPREANPQA